MIILAPDHKRNTVVHTLIYLKNLTLWIVKLRPRLEKPEPFVVFLSPCSRRLTDRFASVACIGVTGVCSFFSPSNVAYMGELNQHLLQTKGKNACGIHHRVCEHLEIDWKETLFSQSKN